MSAIIVGYLAGLALALAAVSVLHTTFLIGFLPGFGLTMFGALIGKAAS